jgi:Protein of unknown function (DUF3891)
MILRRDGTDWLYINQLDHSRLAGRLMAAWQADGFPTRSTRAKVLQATSDHDLGWQIPDAVPRISAEGQPYDFVSAPLEIKQPPFGRAVETLAAEDPYVAALVAQHAITVYRRFAQDPAWRSFFAPLEQRRDDLVAQAAPAGFESFLLDYAIVGLGDLFSLVFCNGWQDPYLMESYQAILRDNRLTISPDPFAGATVPLEIVARRIPVRTYASDQDLRDTLAQATPERLTGVAAGAPLPPIA